MRLFVALPLPAPLRTYASRVQEALRQHGLQGKWVRPERMHLTLHFLGDQPSAALPHVKDALRRHFADSATVVLGEPLLDTFGRPPRVLALRLEDPDRRFAESANRARDAARQGGPEPGDSPPRERPPVPHLTLARFRGRSEACSWQRLAAETTPETLQPRLGIPPGPSRTVLTSVVLYESVLRPDGPIYSERARVQLTEGPAQARILPD